MVNAQEWLDQNYPDETRNQIKELDVSGKSLEGSLKLSGFTSLQKFDCSSNQLTKLSLADTGNLVDLNCSNNPLANLALPYSPNLNSFDCLGANLSKVDNNSATPTCPNPATNTITVTAPYSSVNSSSSGNNLAIGLGVSGFGLVGLLSIGAFVWFWKQRKSQKV